MGARSFDDEIAQVPSRDGADQHFAPNSNMRVRICKFYNDGTYVNDDHHSQYKHFCAACYRQGKSLGHPEFKCTTFPDPPSH